MTSATKCPWSAQEAEIIREFEGLDLSMCIDPGMTIRCQEVVELITDYLERQLDSPTRTEFEAHLPLCEGCGEYLRQMRATIRALGHVPLDSLSETAQADLLAAFRDFPVRP